VVSKKSLEEEIKIKAQSAKKLARYMSSTQDLVENQIRKAMDNGEFNNLEGAGKPLNLEENAYEPADMRMVNKILKDNNFVPYWIDLGKEIDSDWKKLQDEIDYFQRYTRMVYQDKRGNQAIKRYEGKKAYFYSEKRLELEKISRKIIDYNLYCPIFRLGRANIVVDDDMYKIIVSLESLIEEMLNSD